MDKKNISSCPYGMFAVHHSHFISKTTIERCYAALESKLTKFIYCILVDYCLFGFLVYLPNNYVRSFDRRMDRSFVELWHKALLGPAY